MCKTYLDALGPDKTMGTLYGSIVGMSALGNHIVRTLLIPNLQNIQDRILQGGSANGNVKEEGNMLANTSAPNASASAGDKRKRAGSVGEGREGSASAVDAECGLSRAEAARRMQD